MSDLTSLTLKAALDGLAARRFSAVELAQAHLDALAGTTVAYMSEAAANPHLNAYVLQTPDKALAMAAESDRRRAAGEAGALEGACLGVKDLFCTDAVQTTAGSNMLKGFAPPYESTGPATLWRDGAVTVDS